jgi:hypothetical protein
VDTYQMPDVRLPFVTATHPQAPRLQELTEQWCQEFGLLRSPDVVTKFSALGYGRIMATLCPYVPLDTMSLITDWNSFFFIADDQQNNAITTNRVRRYEDLADAVRHVIADDTNPTPADDHPIVAALRDLLRRTLPDRPPYWQARFRANLDLWLTGHLAENSYRLSGTVPQVPDYISVRRNASTVLPTLDLVEMAERAMISDELYRTPQYRTLVLGTADIMCWINDIHSLHMEQDDPINFVTVLTHHQHLETQRAMDAVAARIAARVQDHLTAARELPLAMDGLEPAAQKAIMWCVQDQQSWAAGMEAWDRTDTIRFADSEVPTRGTTASYVEDLLAD